MAVQQQVNVSPAGLHWFYSGDEISKLPHCAARPRLMRAHGGQPGPLVFVAIQAEGESQELFRSPFGAQRRGDTQGGGSRGTHRSAGTQDQCRSHSAGLGETGLPRRAACTA